ncbi:MAG: hypothetical protein PHS93_05150 [Candidatus Omnitrophica bacterium]|nr:hypothetical protein [Candidatus Omnitrophota bacterium]MDD5352540.1 hypothetical protein [Candidatus Omnitrophota bacterium]MDD5550138.1 hypothetical protein [Candidatus Omnitrophota bacterium]
MVTENRKISEAFLAATFEDCLRKKCFNEFPEFKLIAREISCRQGIADFITISGHGLEKKYFAKINHVFDGSTESYIKVFSLLRHLIPRSKKYIIENSGLSLKTIKSILTNLRHKKAILELPNGYFILSPKWRIKSMELWAFELKISNWKRALFQSLQYRAFADRLIIVFPVEKENLILKNIGQFKKFKIGVMVFDALKQKYKILLPPIKNKPASEAHRLFAFSRITSSIETTIGIA